MKILAYNNQALSINGKGIYVENLSALAENGSLIKIVTPIVNKGDLIYLDVDGNGDKLYRVLKCKGDVAKVVAMYDNLTSKYNETSTTTDFNGTTAQKYEGSTLDTYLNITWYNTLSSAVKNAIVPENVVQYCYQYYDKPNTPNTPTYTYQYQYNWSDSDYENANNVGNVVIGNRNVFALDLKDIFDYIGKVCITSDELMTMFWNSKTKVQKFLWLRSSYADGSGHAWGVRGYNGILNGNVVTNIPVVRPAFNINLSQIPFTIYRLPVKGDIVKLNLDGTEREYRVLSMNGSVAKVVAMYDDLTSKYNSTSTTTTMGSLTVQKYEGSTIDTYLNTTWYNTLTSATKAAIVPENVVCDAWYRNNTGDPDYTGTYGSSVPGTSNYTISKYAGGTLNIGNRNVFALGVQDVIDYLNDSSVQVDTSAILRNVNIWKMFWNDEVSHSGKYLWLRSSFAGDSRSTWFVRGDSGFLYDGTRVRNSYVVRPALNLNLNQVEFTIV